MELARTFEFDNGQTGYDKTRLIFRVDEDEVMQATWDTLEALRPFDTEGVDFYHGRYYIVIKRYLSDDEIATLVPDYPLIDRDKPQRQPSGINPKYL